MAQRFSVSVPCPVTMPDVPGGVPQPPKEPVWWMRRNPVGEDYEFAQLTNIKPGWDGSNWTGYIETRGQYGYEVGGDPTVYHDGDWKPCNFVKDGRVNVWRPRGIRWEEDPKREGLGKWVKIELAEGEEDDGGMPLAANLPQPEPGEQRKDWEKRCKQKYAQIDKRSSKYRDLLDQGWRRQGRAA